MTTEVKVTYNTGKTLEYILTAANLNLKLQDKSSRTLSQIHIRDKKHNGTNIQLNNSAQYTFSGDNLKIKPIKKVIFHGLLKEKRLSIKVPSKGRLSLNTLNHETNISRVDIKHLG